MGRTNDLNYRYWATNAWYAVAIASVTTTILTAWSLSTAVPMPSPQAAVDVETGTTGAMVGQVPIPMDSPRVGVPMLVAYPLAMLPDPHIEVNEGDYPWFSRTIKYGETTITDQEMKEYFDLYSTEKSHYFAVKSSNGNTNYYSIEFYEPPIVLEQYNVKAYTLDVPPEKFTTVNLKDEPWLQELVKESHVWMPVDAVSANSLRQLSDTAETFNFKVVYEDGHEEYYNIRYAGPELSSLS